MKIPVKNVLNASVLFVKGFIITGFGGQEKVYQELYVLLVRIKKEYVFNNYNLKKKGKTNANKD